MTLPSPSWLLVLAVFCHLTTLLEGQHLGVKKCSMDCDKMTKPIPVSLLIRYQRNEESCGKRAIILETKKNRFFCANPDEEWVKKAMQHLDLQASSLTLNGGTFAKQIGVGEPRTTPAPQAVDEPALPEPKATEQNSEQEMQRDFSLGTPTELPMAVASSWGTRPPSTSEALDGGSPVGPTRTKLVSTAAVTSTTTSWQSSAANQPGSVLGADKKGPEASATQAPPTQAPTTQASPTQAPSTQTFSTQNPPTKAPPSQAPSTQVPVMSTIAPTAPEDSVGLITGQGDPAEASLEPEELGPPSAHTDAFMGPQASEVPITSEGDPSREPVASGSWPPKAEEPIHVTGDPQRLGILMTPVPDSQVATRRQAVGLLAFLGLLFCVGVAMFAYQSLQGCPRKVAGDMVEGLRYVPRSCGSNSYVLVPV